MARSRMLWNVLGLCLIVLAGIGAYQSLTGAAAGKTPDLLISTLTAQNNSGGTYTFLVTVLNQGNGRAITNDVTLQIDTMSDGTWDTKATLQHVGQLSPGASARLSWSNAGAVNVFGWQAVAGKHKVQACADVPGDKPKGVVTESNESNNCKVIDVLVR